MSGYSVEETSQMNGNFSLEEPRTEYNGYFPKDLPPRPGPPPAASGPFRGRWRSFRTFSLSSFSVIHTPDGAARIRHIAMIAILLLRSAMSGLSILSAVTKGKIPDVIVYSLLAVLTLYFTATCLATIGDAAGDKCLKGLVVKRWHLDTFLGLCVVVHAGLIIAFFFGLGGWGEALTSLVMWFAILAVAYIAGWQGPELPRYERAWAS